jgi:hypothetical protein
MRFLIEWALGMLAFGCAIVFLLGYGKWFGIIFRLVLHDSADPTAGDYIVRAAFTAFFAAIPWPLFELYRGLMNLARWLKQAVRRIQPG